MMYLIDLPSLSSLNLLTHSGATVTLVKVVVSVEWFWTGIDIAAILE